jgi:hypothetical protein
MFFVGMKFAPSEALKQSDLNRIVVELLRRVFVTRDGQMLEVKHPDHPMLSLVQLLVDLDIRLDEKTFAGIPDDIKKHFKVIHRDGTEYRYGNRPRWL